MFHSSAVSPFPSRVGFSYGVLADTRLWISLLIGWKAVRQVCAWMRDFGTEYACAGGDGTSKCRDTREEEWTMHRVLQVCIFTKEACMLISYGISVVFNYKAFAL